MKTYQQKLDELRLKDLREIETGLNHEETTTRFINSIFFFNFVSPETLKDIVPISSGKADDNETGAEILVDEKGEN